MKIGCTVGSDCTGRSWKFRLLRRNKRKRSWYVLLAVHSIETRLMLSGFVISEYRYACQYVLHAGTLTTLISSSGAFYGIVSTAAEWLIEYERHAIRAIHIATGAVEQIHTASADKQSRTQ